MKRINIFVTGLAFLLITSFSGAAEDSEIHRFAMSFIEAEKLAWENGEFDDLLALEHPDVIFQNINGTVFQGWDEHKQAIIDAKNGFMNAEIETEWQYLMGEGNMFAVSYIWSIHISDQPLVIQGIAIGRIEDGKLKEEWGAGSTISAPSN